MEELGYPNKVFLFRFKKACSLCQNVFIIGHCLLDKELSPYPMGKDQWVRQEKTCL